MLLDIYFGAVSGLEKDESGFEPSDWIALAALLVSLISVYLAYRSVFIARKLEITFKVFELTGIENIERLLKPVDEYFENKGEDTIGTHLNSISEHLTDLELFAFQFCQLYNNLDHTKLIRVKDRFSDLLFLNQGDQLKFYKAHFLGFKTKFIQVLYQYTSKHKQFRNKKL